MLIFTSVSTTTLGYAINCPIPIVLIDFKTTPWIKEKKTILKKRMALISSYDNKSYKNIRYKELERAINKAKGLVNLNVARDLSG